MTALLIEDHLERQKKFFPNYKDFEELKGLNVWIGDQAKTCIHQINEGAFSPPDSTILIMIHFTALLSGGNRHLIELCKDNSIDLVFYSGSINQTTYSSKNGQILMLNSQEFYSNRLIPFLDKIVNSEKPNLLELSNEQWELSYYFLLRQLLVQKKIEKDPNENQFFDEKIENAKRILNISNESVDKSFLDKRIQEIIIQL